MDVELLLFLIVGGIAVFAAVMMLLDDNPVQSALFLILNFGCVAFLYLMLDAGFLAMVQVAVYAGAIMVLFLFVIMLLGAERETTGSTPPPRSLWIAIMAMALAFVFTVLLAGYAAGNSGELEAREKPAGPALVRVAHAAPDAASQVSVFLNGEALTESVRFRAFSDYVEVPAGEYEVSFGPADGEASEATAVTGVTLEPDNATTIVAYNDGDALVASAVSEDLSLIEGAEGRLVVFNTYPEVDSVSLVQIDSDFRFADAADAQSAKVYAGNIDYGAASETVTLGAGELRAVFIPDVEGSEDEIITRLRDFEIEEDASTFIVLGLDAEAGDLPTTSIAVTPAAFQFGGPESVGEALFTGYVLPLETVALLLLVAMVGAIVLTQRVEPKPKPGRPTRRKVSRPLTSVIASQTGHTVEDAGTDLEVVEQSSGD